MPQQAPDSASFWISYSIPPYFPAPCSNLHIFILSHAVFLYIQHITRKTSRTITNCVYFMTNPAQKTASQYYRNAVSKKSVQYYFCQVTPPSCAPDPCRSLHRPPIPGYLSVLWTGQVSMVRVDCASSDAVKQPVFTYALISVCIRSC